MINAQGATCIIEVPEKREKNTTEPIAVRIMAESLPGIKESLQLLKPNSILCMLMLLENVDSMSTARASFLSI